MNIKICLPNRKYVRVPTGTSLLELSQRFSHLHNTPIVAATVDNELKSLNTPLVNDCRVKFIDLHHPDGLRIYKRSLYFLLIKAANDILPGKNMVISHSISNGTYCKVKSSVLTADDVQRLHDKMLEFVKAEIPFIKHKITSTHAHKLFGNGSMMDKFPIAGNENKSDITIYDCGGFQDYFYGYMVPDSSYLKMFELKHYPPGLVLLHPNPMEPTSLPKFIQQEKLFEIFSEFKQWSSILRVDNIERLNAVVRNNGIGELIRISEALHEKKIAQIADMITTHANRKKLVLIAGPSSSGKTTFSHRLAVQLRVNGITPVTISLDNYFLNREDYPLDEYGKPDFESIHAVDLPLFNAHLSRLISGLQVEVPIFNFTRKKREAVGKKLKLKKGHVLVIEGIHGLNPLLSESIPKENKFKIYVSALTSTNVNDHNTISTTDNRLIRRIVRDASSRGCSALGTIKIWNSVRRGEENNIFPFQEDSDIMFNSYLVFELGILKALAEPLLNKITRKHEAYSEAKRLLEFLRYFLPIHVHPNDIPNNSILREFIGGGCFPL